MAVPPLIKTRPSATYGVLIALVSLCGLVVAAIVMPGCTGPISDQPCDYVGKFKAAVAQFRGHSPYFPVQVLDVGSSVYVLQTAPPRSGFMLHTPGALIDKKSCRVCQADAYATRSGEEGLRVLASAPPDKPLSSRPGLFGY